MEEAISSIFALVWLAGVLFESLSQEFRSRLKIQSFVDWILYLQLTIHIQY